MDRNPTSTIGFKPRRAFVPGVFDASALFVATSTAADASSAGTRLGGPPKQPLFVRSEFLSQESASAAVNPSADATLSAE